MDIKLIALDLDGTILNNDGGVSELTLDAIAKALAAGIIVVPATGRTLSEIPDEIRYLTGIRYAIVSNGASVMDLDKTHEIYANLMSLEVAKQIFEVLYEENLAFEAYSEGVSFGDEQFMHEIVRFFGSLGNHFTSLVERMRFVNNLPAYFEKTGRSVEKIYVHYIEEAQRLRLEKAICANPSVISTSSDLLNMEINAATANKGDGLMQLCRGLGIERAQVMAIGDGNNDLQMLAFAGLSVAMGNAVPAAKQWASYVTVSNDDEGVAVAMRKFLGL